MLNIISKNKNKDSDTISKSDDILDILLNKKWLIKPQVDHIRNESKATGKSVSKILEENNIISSDKLLEAYSQFFDLPIIKLKNLYIPRSVLDRIPEELSKKYFVVAFDQTGDHLKVAIASPEKLQTDKPGILSNIKKKQNVEVELFLTSRKDFQEAIKEYSRSDDINPDKKTEDSKNNPTILDILISQKLLLQSEAFEIKEKSKEENKTIEGIIRENGNVSPDDLAKAQAIQYHMPFVALNDLDIKVEDIKKFPQDIALEYKVVVFDTVSDKILKLATSWPENPRISDIIKFLKEKSNIEGKLFVTTPKDIEYALSFYHQLENTVDEKKWLKPDENKTEQKTGKEETEEESEDVGRLDLGALIKKDIENEADLVEITKSEDVPRIVAGIINYALVKNASDIHLEPWADAFHVRYRIDGVLKDIIQIDKRLHSAVIARIKISARLRLDEQRIPQDGRFDVNFKDRIVDIRVSTLPTSHGEKAVLRLLDKTQRIISLEELGLTGKGYDIISKDVKKPYGMVLATGPTGSGKTTTLYAILQSINSSQTNIVTLEDPIEYELDGVNHCQVRSDIGFSFAEGLRSILRQDPNIIMVGEIRDTETAGMAVQSSLTGHLVLSTLHTNDAAGAIPRLLDMKVEPFLIASSLSSIIAQRLVRKICKKCKEKITLPPEILEKVEKELNNISKSSGIEINEPYEFFRGKGCDECDDGYVGRLGIFEVMSVTQAIEDLTIKQVTSEDLKNKAIEEGMITMRQDGLVKALKGITTIDEVFRVTSISS
jgi:type II secretory ATPase GspE/PulE/Tfp pilus assembly ATPase PilB-like protein